MKNTATNTLSYSGIVTLSQQIGKNKVVITKAHNTGGESLFNFLADCLVGKLESANVPTKIKLVNREKYDDANYKYESASGFVFLRSPAEKTKTTSGECCVRYSFIIPRDILENIANIETLGIGLYARSASEVDPENFIAFCPVKFNVGQIINSSLLVDWDLIISNATASITKRLT
jgi:hypothetical protein